MREEAFLDEWMKFNWLRLANKRENIILSAKDTQNELSHILSIRPIRKDDLLEKRNFLSWLKEEKPHFLSRSRFVQKQLLYLRVIAHPSYRDLVGSYQKLIIDLATKEEAEIKKNWKDLEDKRRKIKNDSTRVELYLDKKQIYYKRDYEIYFPVWDRLELEERTFKRQDSFSRMLDKVNIEFKQLGN